MSRGRFSVPPGQPNPPASASNDRSHVTFSRLERYNSCYVPNAGLRASLVTPQLPQDTEIQ